MIPPDRKNVLLELPCGGAGIRGPNSPMYNMLPEDAMTVVTTEGCGERSQKRD